MCNFALFDILPVKLGEMWGKFPSGYLKQSPLCSHCIFYFNLPVSKPEATEVENQYQILYFLTPVKLGEELAKCLSEIVV